MNALELALAAIAAGMGALAVRGWWQADGLRMALETALIGRSQAEAALARLKRKRSEAVARGNRTRAAKNRARVIEKAQAMRAALESKAGEDAETTADEITGTDAAQMPLGLG